MRSIAAQGGAHRRRHFLYPLFWLYRFFFKLCWRVPFFPSYFKTLFPICIMHMLTASLLKAKETCFLSQLKNTEFLLSPSPLVTCENTLLLSTRQLRAYSHPTFLVLLFSLLLRLNIRALSWPLYLEQHFTSPPAFLTVDTYQTWFYMGGGAPGRGGRHLPRHLPSLIVYFC